MTSGQRRTLPRAMLRWCGPLLAFLAVTALVRPASGAAPAPQDGSIWAGEWEVVGGGAREAGALSGLQQTAVGAGVMLVAASDSGSLESPVHDMGHEFLALAAVWQDNLPDGSGLSLEVRRSLDGQAWEPWETFVPDPFTGPDGAPPADSEFSELLFGKGRYVQVRATLQRSQAELAPRLDTLKIVAIDPGPSPAAAPEPVAAVGNASAQAAPPYVITRAQWGANEAWMTWPPSYAAVSHFIIHHTATPNYDADVNPYGVVRSIYYYHAITRGWGDIGYNFLVDRQGRIYEGRYGGDGAIGGHALQYNTGSVGVAILGDYDCPGCYVPSAALSGLESLLAWKCARHNVDPLASRWLYDRTLPTIMGHRDCNSTTCPGQYAYPLLPQVRGDVAARLQSEAPTVTVTQPGSNQKLAAIAAVTWQVNAAVSQVTVAVDGQARVTLPTSTTSWAWNTTGEADGPHQLRLTARNPLGQSGVADVPVEVDNTPPTGSLSAPPLTNRAGVTLTLACQGCTGVQFGAGWRWEGEDLFHQVGVLATDPAAANGRAWLGRVADGRWGAWYGPYFCGLPAPGDYEATFWLRVGRNDLAAKVADLDISDHWAGRFLAGPLAVRANDFARLGSYQAFRLPFHYPDPGESCQSSTVHDGLELRTWYQPNADLWLDRVEILSAPRPFATSAWCPLPSTDGSYTADVRFVDAAGNVSPVYTRAVMVDRTAPAWGQPGSAGLPVAENLSGLVASAAYAISDDGIHWGSWVPVTLALGAGGKSGVLAAQPAWEGYCVRVRVQDQAGNVGYSPPIRWPAATDPAPEYRWWTTCGARVYQPLIVR